MPQYEFYRKTPSADMGQLFLKRAKSSRSSGQWKDDDYDVIADGVVVGRIFNARGLAGRATVDVDFDFRASRRPHADVRLRRDARGRHGCVREELAAGEVHEKAPPVLGQAGLGNGGARNGPPRRLYLADSVSELRPQISGTRRC